MIHIIFQLIKPFCDTPLHTPLPTAANPMDKNSVILVETPLIRMEMFHRRMTVIIQSNFVLRDQWTKNMSAQCSLHNNRITGSPRCGV